MGPPRGDSFFIPAISIANEMNTVYDEYNDKRKTHHGNHSRFPHAPLKDAWLSIGISEQLCFFIQKEDF